MTRNREESEKNINAKQGKQYQEETLYIFQKNR